MRRLSVSRSILSSKLPGSFLFLYTAPLFPPHRAFHAFSCYHIRRENHYESCYDYYCNPYSGCRIITARRFCRDRNRHGTRLSENISGKHRGRAVFSYPALAKDSTPPEYSPGAALGRSTLKISRLHSFRECVRHISNLRPSAQMRLSRSCT